MAQRKILLAIMVLGTVVLLWDSILQPVQAAEYFEGKTIALVVGFAPGGGNDIQARLFTKFLQKHVPGHPTFIVKNLPGGGSVRAHNILFEKTKSDGRTLLFGNWQSMAQALNRKGVRFDYRKFTVVGTARGPERLLYARTDCAPGGLKKSADILKAKNLILVGTRPTSNLDLRSRPTLDLLGLKYVYVPGYGGGSQTMQAVRRGEGNVAPISLRTWRSSIEPTMVKEGIVVPLFYWPFKGPDGKFVKSSYIDDMPSFVDFFRTTFGRDPSGPYWDAMQFVNDVAGSFSHILMGPPGMNKKAAAALTRGWYAALKDPDQKKKHAKSFGYALGPVTLSDARGSIGALETVDPKMVAFWNDYIAKGMEAMPK